MPTHVRRHQFALLLGGTLVITIFFVFIALRLYKNSGAILLDLSRPGYAVARQEVAKDSEVFEGFSSDGTISTNVLDEFDRLYTAKASEASAIEAFSGDVLSDKTLQLK